MSAELERLVAAQAAADRLVRELCDPIDGRPMLLVAVTDMETDTRLAAGFAHYDVPAPALRLVGEA
ncbi:hypothetical protein ACKI1J_14965 [Streptomyces scabiei]|uniref:hypothetical protein n=1 Tax=Streptomyces scabiei TaxID=1930 RepID=UPI001846B4C2|nr:hypothetical protein [Streptomyces sp.]